MSNAIFGIGVSGLMVSQRNMATIGHNIANANNPAYSRQRVDIVAREPGFTAGGFMGNGAMTSNVRRTVDDFLTSEVRVATSASQRIGTVNDLARQLDNLLANPEAGLSPVLDRFFGAVQDLADDPVSIATRNVALSEARILAQRMNALDTQIGGVEQTINTRVRNAVSEINTLSEGIAKVNDDIRRTMGIAQTGEPNDLLDRRDELVRQLSELVDVNVLPQGDGTVSVAVGSGQPLVVGVEVSRLVIEQNPYDAARPEVAYEAAGSQPIISHLVSGGRLGGLLQAREALVDEARNVLGRVGITLTETINAQHQRGLDLEGNTGQRIFTDLATHAPRVAAHAHNGAVPPPHVDVRVSDVTQLTNSDYRLEAQGGRISMVRLADGVATDITDQLVAGGYPATSATVEIDGLALEVDGALANGDSHLIQPTRLASRQMAVEIGDPRQLAAASPVASGASLANAGSADISPAAVVDPDAYMPGTYEVRMTAATDAVVDGTRGVLTDAGVDDPLGYVLEIDGEIVYDGSETPPPAPPASLGELAAVINGAGAGVRAQVHDNGAGEVLHLSRDPARDSPIRITERLTGASEAGDSVTGFFGSTLNGPAAGPDASATVTLDAVDSYVVTDAGGAPLTSGPYVPGESIGFAGMEVGVDGSAALGDTFTVGPNTNGVGDNRNALAIADLQLTGFINDGTATYQDAYGELVVHIGGITRESQISREAQDTLLQNAVSARDAVSGVNLDEEAANLMRFQQAYQASAQVITAAQTMFDALLGAVRG